MSGFDTSHVKIIMQSSYTSIAGFIITVFLGILFVVGLALYASSPHGKGNLDQATAAAIKICGDNHIDHFTIDYNGNPDFQCNTR